MECLSPTEIVGVIVAGGLSRRMGGGDKGLLRVGSSTMLAEVARRLAPQVGAMVLNANGDARRFAELGLPVIADGVEAYPGPLAGILSGMRWARAHGGQAPYVLTVSSDVPFLPPDLAARLASHLPKGRLPKDQPAVAIAASAGNAHPVIGLWPTALADDLEASLRGGMRKVMAWAERHGAIYVDFPALMIGAESVDPFFNANTPAELNEATRLLALARA